MSDVIVFAALVGVIAVAGIALGTRMASFVGRLAGPIDEDLADEPSTAGPESTERETP